MHTLHQTWFSQPVKDADVYLFQNVMHNWPNDDCTQILTYVVQILKPQAHILIMDIVVPELGSPSVFKERLLRARDLNMLQPFNHPERSFQDWKAVLSRVDGGLEVKNIDQPAGSVLSIIELGLEVEPVSNADGAWVQLWSTVSRRSHHSSQVGRMFYSACT